jgi:hypothetical protein
VAPAERSAAKGLRLSPAQQSAFEGVLLGLERGCVVVLRDMASDGKTTVLNNVRGRVGGARIGISDFLTRLAAAGWSASRIFASWRSNQFMMLGPFFVRSDLGDAAIDEQFNPRGWSMILKSKQAEWKSVKEAGSLNQDAVIKALDHAKIAAGPGGPAEMAPGQHHARLNIYIAQASNGIFKVVKNLGAVEPNEKVVPASQGAAR